MHEDVNVRLDSGSDDGTHSSFKGVLLRFVLVAKLKSKGAGRRCPAANLGEEMFRDALLVFGFEELNSFIIDADDDLVGEISVADAAAGRKEGGAVISPFLDDAEVL